MWIYDCVFIPLEPCAGVPTPTRSNYTLQEICKNNDDGANGTNLLIQQFNNTIYLRGGCPYISLIYLLI